MGVRRQQVSEPVPQARQPPHARRRFCVTVSVTVRVDVVNIVVIMSVVRGVMRSLPVSGVDSSRVDGLP